MIADLRPLADRLRDRADRCVAACAGVPDAALVPGALGAAMADADRLYLALIKTRKSLLLDEPADYDQIMNPALRGHLALAAKRTEIGAKT